MSNFSGQSLYREGYEPDASQKQARLERYYHPYYTALMSELQELSQQYRHVLLFDAHSIRRQVPSITPQPFPDLIIGDRDGSSAHPLLTQTLRVSLASSVFEVACNRPFKGGQITRFFGQAAEGRHALQLEMSQDLYLLERTHEVDPVKAQSLQPVLADALLALARTLESL